MKDKNDEAFNKKEAPKTEEELKSLVQEHKVCWEVLPEQIPVKEELPLKIGFNLMLYGAHAPEEHPIPGCEKCQRIFSDLRKIATWIIPKEERESRYEIFMFDSSLAYSPVRRNRPDVSLTIKIMHRSKFDRPVDECEVLCLNEMKDKLSELGVPEKQWRERIG
jgi:hypothetical protein